MPPPSSASPTLSSRLPTFRAAAERTDRFRTICGILPAEGPGLTREEVMAAWMEREDAGRPPGKSALAEDLKRGLTSGLWSRSGKGDRTGAYRYYGPKGVK